MRQREKDQCALAESDDWDEFSEEEDAIAKFIADGEKENWLRWSLLALGVIVLVSAAAGSIVWLTTTSKAVAGQFGDTFGFVNAVVSGMAFALFFITLLMQRHELGFQRKELRLNLIEMKRSRREYAKMVDTQQESEKRMLLAAFVSSAESLRQMLERRTKMERTPFLENIEESLFLDVAHAHLKVIHEKIRAEVEMHCLVDLRAPSDPSRQVADRLLPAVTRLIALIRKGDGDDGSAHGTSLHEAMSFCAAEIRGVMHMINPSHRGDIKEWLVFIDKAVEQVGKSTGEFDDPMARWGDAKKVANFICGVVNMCAVLRN
jgi:hypothetical protein